MVFAIMGVSAFAQYDNLYFDPEVDENLEVFAEEVYPSGNEQYTRRSRLVNRYNGDLTYADRIARFRRGGGMSFSYGSPYFQNDFYSSNYGHPFYDRAYSPYGRDRVIIYAGSPYYAQYRWNNRYRSGFNFDPFWMSGYSGFYNPFWDSYNRQRFFNSRSYDNWRRRDYRRDRRSDRRNYKSDRQKYIERNGRRTGSRYGNYRSRAPKARNNGRVKEFKYDGSKFTRKSKTRKHNGRG